MRIQSMLVVPATVLALGLSTSLASAEQRRGSRAAEDGERGGRVVEQGGGRERERGGDQSVAAPDRGGDRAVRRDHGSPRRDDAPSWRAERRTDGYRDGDRGRDGRAYGRPGRQERGDRGPNYRHGSPRVIVPRYAPRRYYGPGGNYSVYFGWGSGYRFGNWYTGRVYGYVPPATVYGARRFYGDIRLLVRPRVAQVYVDGYYAGIVDDFDGMWQQLRLDDGGHRIEVRLPGLAPLTFDVMVQPGRTITYRGDLTATP